MAKLESNRSMLLFLVTFKTLQNNVTNFSNEGKQEVNSTESSITNFSNKWKWCSNMLLIIVVRRLYLEVVHSGKAFLSLMNTLLSLSENTPAHEGMYCCPWCLEWTQSRPWVNTLSPLSEHTLAPEMTHSRPWVNAPLPLSEHTPAPKITHSCPRDNLTPAPEQRPSITRRDTPIEAHSNRFCVMKPFSAIGHLGGL